MNPISAIQALGYTEREAAFLYLVAAHAGYFVRRQFDYFCDRNKGALVMRFLEKTRGLGHVECLDYRQGWHVYHLRSRTIYRLLGDPESQLRRRKGDAQIRARLMALDCVLENDDAHYFASEAERIRFFTETRGIDAECIIGSGGRLLPLLAAFPVLIENRLRPVQSTVRFAFVDEGFATVERFLRFLAAADALLRALGSFEVIYVAASDLQFAAAKAAFWSRFSAKPSRASRLFEEDVRFGHAQLRARFTTLLLGYSYPKLQRSESRGSREGSHEPI